MKNIIKIITTLTVFSFIFVAGITVFAQEKTPLGKLAEGYILRLNSEEYGFQKVVPEPTVVNPEVVQQSALEESIETVSKTVEELEVDKAKTISDIKDVIKSDIDASVLEIRKTVDVPAFELQKLIDEERLKLFDQITNSIDSLAPAQSEVSSTSVSLIENYSKKIDVLEEDTQESILNIKKALEEKSDLTLDFDNSKSKVSVLLENLKKNIAEKGAIIESRDGLITYVDSDQDGISDYDEVYIYKTDPNNAYTSGSDKKDGDYILEGKNPLSKDGQSIPYQDPREDKESFVSSAYKLDKIQLVKEDKEKLVMEGTALPNSFITLYIYSTPIIVTVKTDSTGRWSYTLDKELDNGEHQMFVATVDNSGKIIARSNPILFTKSAEAAVIGISGSLDESFSSQNFLRENFIIITLIVLIAVVILGMILVGNHKSIYSAIKELKSHVGSK